jgi:DNA-binding MarR family transcriptional regulator
LASVQPVGTKDYRTAAQEQPVEGSAFLLARLGRVAARHLGERLAETGLKPPEAVILTTLREVGPMTQQALGERLHIDPSNLVAFLNSLEKDELVVRRRDPDDRRRHIVEITEQGLERCPACLGPVAELEDELLAGLSDQEQRVLNSMLSRVLATMAVEEPPATDSDQDNA